MVKMERTLQLAPRKKRIAKPRRALPARVQRVIRRARARIRALLPNGELVSLVLYGSYVYGKPRAGSDVDLILVYDNVTSSQEAALEELVHDLYDERPRLHLFLYPAAKLAQENGIHPLLYNVSHRGITLGGVPVPKLEINLRKVSGELLARAKGALISAQAEINVEQFDASVSRSFYAVLYASDAALACKGYIAKSHEGTEMLFGQYFFEPHLVDAQFKGLFKRIHEARIKADYDREVKFGRDDAVYWFERAQAFVAVTAAGVLGWLAQDTEPK